MRTSNGFIEKHKKFGSPQDDKILDLVVNFNGLFILAQINNDLFPHKSNDKIW